MPKPAIILSLVLFLAIIVGMFVFAYLERKNTTQETAAPNDEVVTEPVDRYESIDRVTAKHFYIDGTHTLAGEITMPTPCDLLESSSSVGSDTNSATVQFTVLNNSDTCIQQLTPARFMTSFTADEDATITATLEGRPIELNLIPAALGETPDSFELFIKG